METKGLTATIIFEAQSLNYDEGYGNLSVLKKLHRGSGEVYTYSSRQSLRYSIFIQGVREFGWKQSEVEEAGSRDQTVTQLITDIDKSEESDLFGYMRTNVKVGEKKEVSVLRTTPIRILPAIALEPYKNDLEMLTNKYQADKIQSNPNIANIEFQKSLYRYTIAIDLHRIGNEEDKIGTRIAPGKNTNPEDYSNYEKELRSKKLNADERKNNEEKANRVIQFLEIIKLLYRDIRGRREDLKPLFIIGGVYDTCNPFFENLVNVEWKKDKPEILTEPIKELLNGKYFAKKGDKLIEKSIKDDTIIGIRKGYFANQDANFNNGTCSPEEAIVRFREKVREYYGVKNDKER